MGLKLQEQRGSPVWLASAIPTQNTCKAECGVRIIDRKNQLIIMCSIYLSYTKFEGKERFKEELGDQIITGVGNEATIETILNQFLLQFRTTLDATTKECTSNMLLK